MQMHKIIKRSFKLMFAARHSMISAELEQQNKMQEVKPDSTLNNAPNA